MMLLAAATFLAVVSSEPFQTASLESSSRLSRGYDEGSQRFGEESLGQDVKNDKVDRSGERQSSNKNLNENDSKDYDQSRESNWLDAVPGVPGKDYPNLEIIPKTSFSCADKKPGGYYADVETRCCLVQWNDKVEIACYGNTTDYRKLKAKIVFHVCNVGGVKSSFLCPPGSIFNQKYLVCDWWYDFECENASDLYSLNESINRSGVESGSSEPREYHSTNGNLKLNSEKESSFAYRESNWVNDGIDLSFAGTGEGGLGYSRDKSSRSFDEYQTDINRGTQSQSQPGENADLAKQFGRQTTLGNDRRNELSQRGSSQQNRAQNENQSIYLSSINNDHVPSFEDRNTFNTVNKIQDKSEDFLSPENRQQFSDYVPRGFAVNYGKIGQEYSNFNQQSEKHDNNQQTGGYDTRSSVVNNDKNSNSGQENYYQGFEKGNKNKNAISRGGNEETVLNSNSDEDEFERERQKEVDNTILNKKTVNSENRGRFDYEYDAEAEKLISENPPSIEGRSYYDTENYFAAESNVPFPRDFTSESKKNLKVNKDQRRLSQNNGERRSSGGFRNGLGNGFPSPNKELAGSNAIAGAKLTVNLRPQNSESYANSGENLNVNSQYSGNKETKVRPGTDNNGVLGDDISVISSVKTSFGSRSPAQITEIKIGRDNSRMIEDELTLRQGNKFAKESFEIGLFSENGNRRNENSNHQNERNQYVPPFNY